MSGWNIITTGVDKYITTLRYSTPGWVHFRVSDPDPDSIRSVDPDPDPYSESGSRRAKITHKSRKN